MCVEARHPRFGEAKRTTPEQNAKGDDFRRPAPAWTLPFSPIGRGADMDGRDVAGEAPEPLGV